MKYFDLIRYRLLPILVSVVVLLGAWALHGNLENAEITQISLIAESESYAARSRLVRNVNTMLGGLRDVQVYWATNAQLPPDEWAYDASLEMSHFNGIQYLLWSEPAGSVRFLRNEAHPIFDHRPEEAEWNEFRGLLNYAARLETDQMRGPLFDDNGNAYFEIYMLPQPPELTGTLIARVDAKEAFEALLRNDSPGYRIAITWNGELIFERGKAIAGLPESWTRSGLIQNTLGAVWEVTHAPLPQLVNTLRTPAIGLARTAGVIIALLMGLLLYENGRAERRARAAEKAEREIADLNRDLEEQVRERTRELAERSQDLVIISESVGHDLRNPLNSISANAQLMQHVYSEALGEDGRGLLDQVQVCVTNMTEILDRLLALSAVASGKFERRRIDMGALAEEIFGDLAVTERDPMPELQLDPVPDANAELIMVRTLLMNLFSNALKYTRTCNERRIRFSADVSETEVMYCVSDNGIGFDQDVADRLFRAFERLEDDLTEGLGLGLDIAARVVQRHRGRIFAHSTPGQGAEFYFTLGDEGIVD